MKNTTAIHNLYSENKNIKFNCDTERNTEILIKQKQITRQSEQGKL